MTEVKVGCPRKVGIVWRTLDVTKVEVGCPGEVGMVLEDGDSAML